ncbi:MAG: heme/hemin ABC transporter substrate-binding protein [Flavobacterium sp.]
MKKITAIVAICLIMAGVSCKKDTTTTTEVEATTDSTAIAKTTHKIVSLNGAVTEIVAALGHGSEIVARDVTSTFPESVKNSAKDLKHVRSISIESIMALQPTLILATDKDMSPELLEKIKAAGVEAHVFTQEFSPEGTKKLIEEVAKVLKHEDYSSLTNKIDEDIKTVKPLAKSPKVLFIYARGAGTLMVAGKNTPVEKMITIAGGQNAITEFEDFKPLTAEALIKGNPDVILMFDSGLGSLGGPQGVLKLPGVDKTNAGKNRKIITMDGALLSGFGPRTGEAAAQLNKLLSENAK